VLVFALWLYQVSKEGRRGAYKWNGTANMVSVPKVSCIKVNPCLCCAVLFRESAPAVSSLPDQQQRSSGNTNSSTAAAAAAAAAVPAAAAAARDPAKPTPAAAAAGGGSSGGKQQASSLPAATTPVSRAKAAAAVVGAAAAPNSAPKYEMEPAATAADIPVPEYGTVAWVINSCLLLIGGRAFEYGELKKAMLQAVIIVITGNGAKYNEPVLFMRIMVRWRGHSKLQPLCCDSCVV